MKNTLTQKTVSGLLWSSIERFSVQGVSFVIGIIIARLLQPSDFGLIGMLAIFLAVSQSFIDSGFSNALIRKQNRTEVDFSTVFYFNIVVGLLFYFLLFFTSPFIAAFYDAPILESLTKVVAINIFINSLAIVQRAKFTINVDFKTQMKASLLAVVLSGTVGITMAYSGFGVWALAVQSIVSSVINVAMLWIYSRWMPIKRFSISSFKEMYAFGSRLLISGLIDTIYKNIYILVIGKKFSTADLGYYTRADSLSQFPSSNITGIIRRVTYPVLSSIQDDKGRLRIAYSKMIKLSTFVIFPMMLGLAAIADPFVHLILTDKWANVVPLLQILCFAYMLYPVHAMNLNALLVMGRSDLGLRLEIIKKILGVVILCLTIPFGVPIMCCGSLVSSFLALFINTHYTGKLLQIGFITQMRDIMPSFLYSFSMGAIVWGITQLIHSNGLALIVSITAGVLYYISIAYMTKSPELREIKTILMDGKKKIHG
jgi:O-antigen/teichoic acid export membrane protein